MTKKTKTYVLDTSVLINDPDVFYKLGDSQIIIPTAVIKEIDGLKRNPDPEEPRAKAARKVSRMLDRLGSSQDISIGAQTYAGSTVRISTKYQVIDDLASNADNRIVGTAIRLKEDTQANLILVSTDGNMRSVTRSYGIKAENYPFYLGDAFDRSKASLLEHKTPSLDLYPFYPAMHKMKRLNRRLTFKQKARFAVALAIIIVLFTIVR